MNQEIINIDNKEITITENNDGFEWKIVEYTKEHSVEEINGVEFSAMKDVKVTTKSDRKFSTKEEMMQDLVTKLQ